MNSMNRALMLALVALCIGQGAPAWAKDPQGPLMHVGEPGPVLGYSEAELEKQTPPARPEDVASPEAIVRAFHDAVDGPKGEWSPDRLRSLCLPNVQLEYVDKGAHGELRIEATNLEQTVKEIKRLHHERAWYEKVVKVRVESVHRIENSAILAVALDSGFERDHPVAHYEGALTTSIMTMVHINNRWWIVSSIW
jgi:hypothetical protein